MDKDGTQDEDSGRRTSQPCHKRVLLLFRLMEEIDEFLNCKRDLWETQELCDLIEEYFEKSQSDLALALVLALAL